MFGNVLLEWLLQNASGPTIFVATLLLVLQWLKPKVESLIDSHISLVRQLNSGWDKTNELIPTLVSFIKETSRKLVLQHTTLLIVEDSVYQRAVIEQQLQPVAHKYGLAIISVPSIEDAIPLVHQARIIILDVVLAETKHPETTRAFISLVSPPVIIFTSLSDITELAGLEVVHKNETDSFIKLITLVEAKLKEPR